MTPCDCQVKDRDPDRPCPVCGDSPKIVLESKVEQEAREKKRIDLLRLMTPRVAPRKEPR